MMIRPRVSNDQVQTDSKHSANRKPYIKPGIIHELELETHAGSPIPLKIDPLDPGAWGSSDS